MLKIACTLAGMAVIAGAAFVVAGETQESSEYVGSQSCQPCHGEKYDSWKSSKHANMLVPVIDPAHLPLDIAKAPENLQTELRKATFMISGSLFIGRDPSTQHYHLLGVIYDKADKSYRPSDLKLDWSTGCAGCHTTNMDTPKLTWSENGIACEACHGPGRNHIAGGGDPNRIVSSKAADICGQCHSGNDRQTGGNLMSDGTKWIVGYRPGMNLSSVPGLQLTPVDPSKIPPDPNVNHLRIYNMWTASGHSQALSRVIDNERATVDCYGCHSAEGFGAKRQGKKIDLNKKNSFNTLTCVACHDAHNSEIAGQLVMSHQELCNSCHAQEAVLQGRGAKGIEATRSFHSAVECVSCHMTEGNHLMKLIRPDDPDLSDSRTDTCTACHRDNNRAARAHQIQDWQSWYKEKIEPLRTDVETINNLLEKNPDLLNAELKSKFNDAQANLSIIIRDGSNGAHNLDYALEIMAQAADYLDEIKAVIK